MTPRNPIDRRKQRIDDLAASSARTGASARRGTASGSVLVDDAGTVDEAPGVSLIASAWRRLRRDPVFLLGAGITLLFVVLAIVSPWIAPHDPAAGLLLDKVRPQSNPIPGPEAGFPLGADDRGRDLLSRLLVGSRQTLVVGVGRDDHRPGRRARRSASSPGRSAAASTRSSCARSTSCCRSPRSCSPSRSPRSPASPASGR